MKKAKLVLAAIAVLAIAGTGIAFKANAKFSGINYFTTTLPNVAATNLIPHGLTVATGTSVYYTFISGQVPPVTNYKPVIEGQ